MNENKSEIYLGGGANMIMSTSKLVSCHEILTLVLPNRGGKTIDLEVKVQADFDTIPEEYHEVFLNMISAKYIKAVSFGDNPFSQCLPPPKKRWWMFWKAK
jgi:hypothetical protein